MAADIFEDVVQTKKNPVLGLATGSSPLPIYAELVRRHREEGLSFAHAKSFTLDEYVGLPEGHPESYQQVIRNELTTLIDIPDEHVYSPDGSTEEILTAGTRYEAAIAAAGGIDVQLLGIGSDGSSSDEAMQELMGEMASTSLLSPNSLTQSRRAQDKKDAKRSRLERSQKATDSANAVPTVPRVCTARGRCATPF